MYRYDLLLETQTVGEVFVANTEKSVPSSEEQNEEINAESDCSSDETWLPYDAAPCQNDDDDDHAKQPNPRYNDFLV